MKRIVVYLLVVLPILALTHLSAGAIELPGFLPKYYSLVFEVAEKEWCVVKKATSNGVSQVVYSANDGATLSVENMSCDGPQRGVCFQNVLRNLNTAISAKAGRFIEITDSECHAVVVDSNVIQRVFAYVLPSSAQIWTFSTSAVGSDESAPTFELLRRLVNRQRYTDALSAGNVSMGHWRAKIYDHATQFFNSGNTGQGLAVLRSLLTTSSFDYKAHVDFLLNTDDLKAATNSAHVVLENAENRALIEAAATFLGESIVKRTSFPVLSTNETGLQLIVVPLPPCNPWLLDEAASCFERITAVPSKVRRLKEEWEWASPERIARQRQIQSMLVRLRGKRIDFRNWTMNMYIQAMRDAVSNQDALSKWYVEGMIEKVKKEEGQYRVDSYIDRFCGMLDTVRSDDHRTMYVGVTEANIYSGDSNYVFSFGLTGGKSRASILSYHMMLGETLGADYQSRKRLIERIAKELVPAALKQIGIPRSTDPRCPYSYSSGVDRLDQKTLQLCVSVKDALRAKKLSSTGNAEQ